ncbi:MAG: DUF885 domain-containing protein [Pseudomonadota bacterium]
MKFRKTAGALALAIMAFAGLSACDARETPSRPPADLNAFVDGIMLEQLALRPEDATSLGLEDRVGDASVTRRLNDYSAEGRADELALMNRALSGLSEFDRDGLTERDRTTYDVADYMFRNRIRQLERPFDGYVISQILGPHIALPSFLANQHAIETKADADDYVARLTAFADVLDDVRDRVDEARQAGMIPPAFIVEKTLGPLRGFTVPEPSENMLVTRLDRADGIEAEVREALRQTAQRIVETRIYPAYRDLAAQHEALLDVAPDSAGLWDVPDGRALYRDAIRHHTTLDETPDALHALGLAEVARIEGEMDAVLRQVGLAEGPASVRVRRLMDDPEHQFPNDDDGRRQLLDYLDALDARILEAVRPVFQEFPEAELEIRRIPAFREASAPTGFYSPAASDGSRPGIFFINLADLTSIPKWILPSLLVHEASPGHHFQVSRAMEMDNLPLLRRHARFTAYAEGWALYTEAMVAEDLGFYDDDPLADLGRLQYEMFRAVRLVVDTGLHDKGWSRQRAIDYMVSKTGMSDEEVVREIERYVAWPGQALGYKLGQIALQRMRENAQDTLGDRFNIRQFHEVVLDGGALPLPVLEARINRWVAARQAS